MSKERIFIIACTLIIIPSLYGCAIDTTPSESPPMPVEVSYPTITYEVMGSEKPFDLESYYGEWRKAHPVASAFFSPPKPSEGKLWRGYAFISIIKGAGEKAQYNGIPLPWTYTEASFQGEFLCISARNLGDKGSITVSIYINGELFKTSTSDGAYVTATVSGMK